ncbi:hypothetical protein JX266_008260 [Neoarthrinium moseri]|nr:hypothetical protein JX266_008260 [Neoarthrinium moseri]
MTDSRSKKAQRLKEARGLRAKAPVAAHFEDCVQAFQRLSDSIQVNQSNSELHQIAEDSAIRLKLWGEGSQASSRSLDYALRNSSILKRQTLRLLKDLHSTLEEAITEVQAQEPVTSESGDVTEASVSPNTSGRQDDAVSDDQEMETGPDICLEEASNVIGYMFQLLPILRDPLEDSDVDAAQSNEEYSVEYYRQIAADMFPIAPESLRLRLADNIWRSRQRLLLSLGENQVVSGQSFLGQRPRHRYRPWDSSLRQTGEPPKFHTAQHRSNRAESDAGTSTIRSHVETVLSKTVMVDQDSVTSATDTPHQSMLPSLVVPQPPVNLERTQQFDCPYCHSELPLIFSTSSIGMTEWEWSKHVFCDLKAYMCTFGDCSHENLPFGDRKEWIQHELDFHRSHRVWFCGLCRSDFRTEEHFTSHLQASHSDLTPDEAALVRGFCKRYSTELPGEQSCALCGVACDDTDELENHLGTHLETLALAALLEDEGTDDEGVEGVDMLVDYIAEQHELLKGDERFLPVDVRTKLRTSPNAALHDNEASHTMNTENFSAPDDLESGSQRLGNVLWTEKVKKFLDKETTQDSIPVVHCNVRSRYDNFVGRDSDLQSIRQQLSTPGRICVISGRGGIGKTAIAVEYLYKFESDYSYVFWVEAENPGLCAEKYGMIATHLNLPEEPFANLDARTYSVRDSLTKSDRRWLLIFDNAASWADISRYIPRSFPKTKGSVLITTRSAPMLLAPPGHPAFHHQHAVELEAWPLEHGREFLLTSIRPKLNKEDLQAHEEYDQAAQVVNVVGGLPLAISMIVGYVKVSRCTLADFLEMWEEKEHIMRKKRRRKVDLDDGDIDSTIDSLWTIGIREVRMNSRRLLDVLSFLDPEHIPKSLLVGDHKEDYLEFLNASETLSYKRMITELTGRRLLSEKQTDNDDTAYTIHRLLQQKVLLDMEDYGFADAFRKAFRLIRKRFPMAEPQQVPNPSSWAVCQEYLPHVSTFCRIYQQNAASASLGDPTPKELAGLFYDAGFYIWSRAMTEYDGLWFFETAEAILNNIDMDPSTKIGADILCVTGLLLLNMGVVERTKGLHRLKHAWQIREQIYEQNRDHDNDVLLQNAANDYALCLLNEHQFEEAGEIFRGCREQYLVWGPENENPFENSKYYGNYSLILMWAGEMETSIKFQDHAMKLTERFLGKKAMYYRRMFMLACILLQSGDLQGALDMHLETLKARLELHGKHNEYTISSMYAVGAMYHHMGDSYTATGYIQQCIECARNSKWDRAALARAQYHLALLYREQGMQEDDAIALEAETDALLEEFGDHAAASVCATGDKMMILDDLQPSFLGRYTGRTLLKHLQEHYQRTQSL